MTKEVLPGSKLTLEAGHHVYRVLRPDGSMECAIDITVIGERLAMRKSFKFQPHIPVTYRRPAKGTIIHILFMSTLSGGYYSEGCGTAFWFSCCRRVRILKYSTGC